MQEFRVYLYEYCDKETCDDLECSHNEVIVVVTLNKGHTEVLKVVEDTQENIRQAVINLITKFIKFKE